MSEAENEHSCACCTHVDSTYEHVRKHFIEHRSLPSDVSTELYQELIDACESDVERNGDYVARRLLDFLLDQR